MMKIKQLTLLLIAFVGSLQIALAEAGVEMADTMRSNGKIYVVVGVIVVIVAGLFAYLINTDLKLKKLEKEIEEKEA